jgi:hypothetical protein
MGLDSGTIDDENDDWGEYCSLREGARSFDRTTSQLPPLIQEQQQQQESVSRSSSRKSIYFDMPPQLHPACSAEVRRVSSCYFSLASSNDNQSMIDLLSPPGDSHGTLSSNENKIEIEGNKIEPIDDSVDLFYHDILMQVFTFLDPNSLLCFSETSRRPNFEVFYFLQLQLQQALLLDDKDNENFSVDDINRIPERTENYSASILSRVARSDMGKARELVDAYQDSNSTLRTMPLSYSLAYVRYYLLCRGFHKMFSNNSNWDETNDYNRSGKVQSRQPLLFDPYAHLPSQQGTDDASSEGDNGDEKKGCDQDDNNEQLTMAQLTETADFTNSTADRKVPSGCVGAYLRAIRKAADSVTSQIKAKRKSTFESLSSEDQRQRSLEFLTVCSSNNTIDRVKEMISVMDVNRFYIGNDGTETCALHTAAFNGADNVVEFLCAGIDLRDSRLDGGLCDVNAKDINGWTALHFAAGANSVAAVRVLAHHGAILNVEAHNGYAPLAWSVRLSNEGVAEELRELMSRLGTDQSGTWMYSKPLASIANHLFSLIPSH